MKKLLLINDTPKARVIYLNTLALFVMMPWDRFYSELAVISLIINTLIHFEKEDLARLKSKDILLPQSVFIVTLLTATYTHYWHQALTLLGLQLHIVILPLLIGVHRPILSRYKEQLLNGFCLTCVAVTVYLFGIALYTIHFYHQPFGVLFSGAFTNHNFGAPMNAHATFLSYLLVIAAAAIIVKLKTARQRIEQLTGVTALLILFAGVVQLSSKTALGCLLIALLVLVPLFYFKGRQRLVVIAVCAAFIIVSAKVLLSMGSFRERLLIDMKKDIDLNSHIVVTNSRLDRAEAVLDTLKRSPLLGFGSGSEVAVTHNVYYSHGLYHSFLENVTAHNQYLSTWINSGLIGLAVLVITLLWALVTAVRKRDLVFSVIMMLIISICATENMFDSSRRCLYYALFFSFCRLTRKVWPDMEKVEENKAPKQPKHDLQRVNYEIASSYTQHL